MPSLHLAPPIVRGAGGALALSLLLSELPLAAAQEPAPAAKPEPYVETIPGTAVKFEMVPVPAGELTAPAPKPARPARPARGARPTRPAAPVPAAKPVPVKGFWIGKTEMTWDAYDIFAFRLDLPEEQRGAPADVVSRPSKPYGAPDEGFGHQGYAALRATYHSASEFCKWLSEKTGKKYRLPTEVEWEYACRAGGKPVKLAPKHLALVAWYWDNADTQTHPVGTKKPNAWGLHDMLGNVWEWATGKDGQPIVCGGSWRDEAPLVHSGARERYSPVWQVRDSQRPKSRWWLSDAPHIGFRVVRDE